MSEVPTWADFWAFVQTPAGLGVLVVAIVGGLKRLDSEKAPEWVRPIGAFVVRNAMATSVGVALLLSLIVFLIGEYNLGQYIERYFVIFALAWATSQGGYALQKAGSMYYGRLRSGEVRSDSAGSG